MSNNTFTGRYDGYKHDNKNRALLVIDVQNEYFSGKLPVCYPHNTLPNIIKAIDISQSNNIPVIVIQHTLLTPDAKAFIKGTHEWELHDDIKAITPSHYIEKNYPSSFVNTDLDSWLKANNIDTLVISGYMTQFCCDTTARYAYHMGYGVEFLSDATATLAFENSAGSVTAEELHRAVLVIQASRFSEVLTTDNWIDRVANL